MSQTIDTKSPRTNRLSRPIRSALAKLRSQIRRYIILEGVAAVVIWIGVTFWLTYAIDYIPVWFGVSELPRPARAIILGIVVLCAGWIVYRLIVNRLLVRLSDQSMALLLERKFPELDESLLTTVQAAERAYKDSVDAALLESTQAQAESVIKSINTEAVVNSSSLNRILVIAGLLVVSVAVVAVMRPDDIELAGQRFYLLGDRTWPRQCHLELVGIKIKRDNPIEGIPELGQIIPLRNDEFIVAKGSSLTLLVRADTWNKAAGEPRRLPDSCAMIYRTNDGNRGQQILKRIGSPRDGYQLYTLDGQPIQGILSDIKFSIRGGDHHIGRFAIKVVDSPAVIETKLECVFPEYIVDQQSMRWTPRTISWTGNSQLPLGTKIRIVAKSNKRLAKVYVDDMATGEMQTIEPTGNQFEYPIEQLTGAENVQFFLCDTDGIVSEQPHTITLQPIEDEPPVVQTALAGIGTAVTPDVRIPISGSIADDYGVARQWVSVFTPVVEPIRIDFDTVDGRIETEIDFKERRQRSHEQFSLPTGEGQQLELVVHAEDRFNLREAPNEGLGDRYVLDLVSPGELLRILERLEVGHRRRLEQLFSEVTEARGYLVRSKSDGNDSPAMIEPGDESSDQDDDPDKNPLRRDEMRLLFSQRAILQIEKSIQETEGIAFEFDSIRQQLINNRVDSADRKERLSSQIVAPLRLIANESMRQLRDDISKLESTLRKLQQNASDRSVSETADAQAVDAIGQIDLVLSQLDQVLSILVKYETQNELLDLVRQLIKQQQEINERTAEENKKQAFESLLDLE